MGNKNLTPEEKEAEVAAQAIAYCLEEDTPQGGICLTSFDPPRRLYNQRIRKRNRLGSDGNSEATPSGGSDYDIEAEEQRFSSASPSSTPPLANSREVGELWNQVVRFAVNKPGFISALLKHASTERIDPSLLLRRISPETEIPHLKESLMNLLRNTQVRNCFDLIAYFQLPVCLCSYFH